MKKILLINIISLAAYFGCFGQIAKYSQYNNIAVITNPALTTMADTREIALHYRKMNLQQGQGISLPSLTFVSPLRYKENGKKRNDPFGAYSFAIVQQRAGTNGIFVTSSLSSSFAYKLAISERNFLGVGMQVSYYNFKVDENRITTDNQYQSGYDPNLPTGETFLASSSNKVYLNAGINWHSIDEKGKVRHWLGVSASNLNQPRTSFLNSGNRNGQMPMLWTVTSGINLRGKNLAYLTWTPSFRYTLQSTISILNVGADASYQIEKNDLIIGVYYSTTSSLFLAIGTRINKFYFSTGYNVNLAQDKKLNQTLNSIESHLTMHF